MKTFRTDRLNLAVYLHASKRLTLTRLDEVQPGKIEFTFNDPEERGAEHAFAFEDGAPCRAISLFASQVQLRRQMSAKLTPSTHGESNDRRTFAGK